ncbi:MAG: hypothetical protein PWQ22_1293 [Archaeoglobaceae archaeon]|nr:hypothetical protein [Archaeoglobaceae archaeon]
MIYALFKDQKDLIIGTIFNAYLPGDYQQRLLKVTGEIRQNFSTQFCRYMPLDYQHTILSGGLLYPLQNDRLYSEQIRDYHAYQWVIDVLSGECNDVIEWLHLWYLDLPQAFLN